ncbi:MAG: hypothetical protein AAGH64_02035 [Planctomycetota bacterium]
MDLSPLTLAQQAIASSPGGSYAYASETIDDSLLVVIALGMVFIISVLLITIVVPVRAHMKNEREREQTKREIAAYIAEGSIPPEEGARLMKAAERPVFDMWGKRC